MPRLYLHRVVIGLFAAAAALLLIASAMLAGEANRLGWAALGVCEGMVLALCGCGWWLAFRQRARARRAEAALLSLRTASTATALRDPLTGLGNYRLFDALLRNAVARAQRYGRPVAILLIEVGVPRSERPDARSRLYEQVLTYIAGVLRHHTRDADTLSRLGDTVFGVIFHETDEEGARKAWERLRGLLYQRWPEPHGWLLWGGIAAYSLAIDAPEALMHEADRQLALDKRRLRADSEP